MFELVAVNVGSDLPSGAQILSTAGVPRRILGKEYAALPEAQLVADDSKGSTVAFGSSGLHGLICLDVGDGTVVHVPNPNTRDRNPVNSSLAKFNECVAAVIARFPFYDEDDDDDAWETVAEELAATLGNIDDATNLHKGFWITFVEDVRMGDYSTTMIADK